MSATFALAHPAGSPPLALPRLDAWPAPLRWALGVSALVHAAALGWLPGWQQAEQLVAKPLQLIIAPPPVPPASTLVVPPPPSKLPDRLERRPAAPAPTAAATLPRPIEAPVPVLTAPATASAAASVAAPIVAAEPPPPAMPPVSAPPHPRAPDSAALAAYGRHLAGAVAAHQRYPRLAQLRQWQGTTLLQLELGADGGVHGMRVVSSSGHEILDKQALDMLRAALPLPALPPALAGRALTIDVPVVFRLAS